MKTDQMILVGAVAFAGLLVLQKTGYFKKLALTSGPAPSLTFLSDTPFFQSPEEQGYDPANPGKYVFTEDLTKGILDEDWIYTPSDFERANRESPFYQPVWIPMR